MIMMGAEVEDDEALKVQQLATYHSVTLLWEVYYEMHWRIFGEISNQNYRPKKGEWSKGDSA